MLDVSLPHLTHPRGQRETSEKRDNSESWNKSCQTVEFYYSNESYLTEINEPLRTFSRAHTLRKITSRGKREQPKKKKNLSQRLLLCLYFYNFKTVLESKAVGGPGFGACPWFPGPSCLAVHQCLLPLHPAESLAQGASAKWRCGPVMQEWAPSQGFPSNQTCHGSVTERMGKILSLQGSAPPSASVWPWKYAVSLYLSYPHFHCTACSSLSFPFHCSHSGALALALKWEDLLSEEFCAHGFSVLYLHCIAR